MSENRRDTPAEDRKPIQILRERHGGARTEAMARHREMTAVRRKIRSAMKEGPKTPPDVARATGLPSHVVFWHLMAMKKYGEVAEGEEREGYFAYALQRQSEEEAP